jgi:epoxide hydrolase-like predicted phosphatase
MAIRGIVFDIGGVLEITPRTGWVERWEERLQLQPGELSRRLVGVSRAGSIGEITIEQAEQSVGEILGLDRATVDELMRDLWEEYVGSPNSELIAYFAGLRPRYRTAILSNSFVGARAIEQELYGFGDICDLIVYSHEEGIGKPERGIFELTCERLGLQPSEVVFLDDVEEWVAAARELGIHGIPSRDNAQAIAEIEAYLKR